MNENEIDRTESAPATDVQENKIKNLTSILILVGGLFVGSLFVDIGQLVTREGFSPRAVRENNILEAAGGRESSLTRKAPRDRPLLDIRQSHSLKGKSSIA